MKQVMKKILICVMLVTITTSAFAQEQGRFRGSINVGYAIPTGGGGIASDVQLGYNILDNMTVGLKWGGALMGRVAPDGENADVSFNSSYLATFTYFFNNGSSRFAPFAGLGAGLFQVASFGAGTDNVTVAGGNKFGGMATVGFEFGKFRLGVEYNLIPASDVSYVGTAPARTSIPNSYFGVTLGFVIGGGRWGR